MKKTIIYDNELKIEAYRFAGISRPFLNHFHEYYVIGLIEKGTRILSCKNKKYNIKKGSIILFNPKDNHTCAPQGNAAFCYRALNIPKETMLNLAEEATGKGELIYFTKNVICDDKIAKHFLSLHKAVMAGENSLKEKLSRLMVSLVQNYGQPYESSAREFSEIDKVCEFIEQHFSEKISLTKMCNETGMSKSTLLRLFTKLKGVTPYRYLETIRINEARALLIKNLQLQEIAAQTGFFDQSRFTNRFNNFTGFTPDVYHRIFLKQGAKNG